jgi:hypothetical protein
VKFSSVFVHPGHISIRRGGRGNHPRWSPISSGCKYIHTIRATVCPILHRSQFNDINGSAWLSSHMSKHDLRFESYSQLSCDKGQAFDFIQCLQLFAHFYSPLKFDHNITQNLVLHCWHWTVRLQWMHSSGLQTIMNSSWNLCLGCNIPSSDNALSL